MTLSSGAAALRIATLSAVEECVNFAFQCAFEMMCSKQGAITASFSSFPLRDAKCP